jgi:putative ABC transport system ATP-binding protein
MEIFRYLSANGKTIVMVTHDDEVASYARRVIHLRDGEIRLDRAL